MGSLAARPGVIRDLWLLNDRWPDTRTFASLAAGIFKFFGAQTEEQKAIAVYDWVCLSMRRGGPIHEGPFGAAGYNLEPGRMFHVHGHYFCDGLGRLMATIWQATGRPARKAVIQEVGHTLGELWYVDADGVGRWHIFDVQKGWYVYDRTGTHVASFAEIAADPTLVTDPSRTSEPFFNHARQKAKDLSDMHWFTHGWVSSITPQGEYYPHVDLLPGQQWEIFYGPEGPGYPGCGNGCAQNTWDHHSNYNEDGSIKNTKVWPWRGQYLRTIDDPKSERSGPSMPHGTARLTWEVPLDPAVLTAACAGRAIGQVRYDEGTGELQPGLSRELAQVIIPIRLPYIITRVQLQADIKRTGDKLNQVIVHAALDGQNWQQLTMGYWKVLAGYETATSGLVQIDITPDTYGTKRWTPVGAYEMCLRVDLLSVEDPTAVALKGLKLIIDTETNLFAHCHLQPGENRLTLAGSGQDGSASVDVAMHWQEAGRAKSAVRKGIYSGDSWVIEAPVDDPGQVRMQKVVYRYNQHRGVQTAEEQIQELPAARA